ncbi:TPA: hypothetical protein DCX66_03575 [Candidatus Nomurabacteria bacterium]|uniref:Uncharacterized protein n=1 Tax=Candidatus Nomurabacteria bacterium GW2011_GWE1_35_16 TaxID=1618761 RepID=A0A0G0DV96_9BACT|nr:MAG: hypothetical protein UR55_C0001G0034 [Candidatus Nomurabacteria bacterium GW2011_GWF1_34_20]KKP63743.1 MAG: hypothetical protein UR57_C0001G0034 [Candidatus Nomurabacteria bacterium GW2011_GWE2_34_25]KKP66955.1 MAG: hypothetical protein UR64_C0001G0034 [Candidatus Nomurabacteria bacterium GW2011_GWE1_35_16]HAE36778.1 hypothetical protein [Candidatus Nomurabacteria bacterium]HAX65519.1 hypothetical protein [Candidatus Nomurabacteria bacterium]
MSILYKSSPFETYMYYVIYPVLMGITAFFIFGILSYGSLTLFTTVFIFIFAFIFILSAESFYRLKYIEVTEDYITIKGITGNKIIEFKNVEYAYNFINLNGNSLVIWYKDSKTQKSKVILVRPDEKSPSPQVGFPIYSYGSAELEITKFIKEKAIKANPGYLYTNKPRWIFFCLK